MDYYEKGEMTCNNQPKVFLRLSAAASTTTQIEILNKAAHNAWVVVIDEGNSTLLPPELKSLLDNSNLMVIITQNSISLKGRRAFPEEFNHFRIRDNTQPYTHKDLLEIIQGTHDVNLEKAVGLLILAAHELKIPFDIDNIEKANPRQLLKTVAKIYNPKKREREEIDTPINRNNPQFGF